MGLIRNITQRLRLWSTEQIGQWLAGYDYEDIAGASGKLRPPAFPYKTSPWVRRAIEAVAGAAASIPIVITDMDGKLIEESPIYSLFGSPFAIYSRRELVYQIVGLYLLTGEAHIVQGMRDPTDLTIDLFGYDQMKALTSKDGLDLLGWEISVPQPKGDIKKYVVDADSVTSWIDPNLYPGSKFRGCGRLASLAMTLVEDQKSSEHNAVLLSRGGGPRGFLKTEQILTPEQAEQLEHRFEAKYAGQHNTGKTAVLGKGTEWKSMVQTNRELLLLDNRKLTRETILSLFDVPPAVVGLYQDSNRAHDESAREGFWVHTIWPTADQVGELLTRAFVPKLSMLPYSTGNTSFRCNQCFKAARRVHATRARRGNPYNIMVWFDLGQVPALRRWHSAQADNAFKWTQAGVPLNQLIEKGDLPFEPVPWGDTWWAPNNVIPADLAIEKIKVDMEKTKVDMDVAKNPPKPPAPPGGDPKPKPPAKGLSPEDKARVWLKWIQSWSGLESKTSKAMRSYFFRQRKEMLKKLDSLGNPKGVPVKATRSWVDELMFDAIVENRLLGEIMTPLLKSGYTLGGAQIAAEVKGENPFSMPDVHWDQFLSDRFTNINGVNATTATKLRKSLNEAYKADETVENIARRIKEIYREASDSRALTIARTETSMSVSSGRYASMQHNSVEYKGWLDSNDEHVRDSHVAAGARYGDIGIPMGDMFELAGGLLSYPGDPGGPASEVVNCRCVLMPLEAPSGKACADWFCNYASPDFKFERWSDDNG